MYGGGQRDEDVPDGVREGDTAVGLEEEHTHQVEDAAQLQVVHRRELVLEGNTRTVNTQTYFTIKKITCFRVPYLKS